MDVAPNIRTLREHAGITQAELARRSGVSKAMICDVESGKKNPTIRLLGQIAQGLGCGISELLDLEETPTITPDRRDDQRTLVDPENGMERRLLSRTLARQGIEVLHYVFPANSEEPWFPAHPKGTWESAYVIEGRARISVGREEVTLEAGDAATYLADREHRVVNAGSTPARMIFVTRIQRGA
jgi:transcriptional regulator with XRE-family HTH domain